MGLVCSNYITSDHYKEKGSKSSNHKGLSETMIAKKRIAIINFTAIVMALYLYDRHNRYCEPGVYSMFSLLEYVVITANVVFHLQAYYDLADYSLVITN